jgi:tryptophan-rich sensory protein
MQWLVRVVFLAVCLAAAGLGAAWTNTSVATWYSALEKPSWNPPDWVFGPVWTCLYVAMAVAAWLVWREKGTVDARTPLLLFAGQLIFNVAWSFLFFALRNPGLAFVDVVLLWLCILATILAFGRVSTWAAALLVPYLAWVSFAGGQAVQQFLKNPEIVSNLVATQSGDGT